MRIDVTFDVNTDSQDEAYEVLDTWIGRTAPELVDSFLIKMEPGDS